jgi:hypothetical protein|tara:strand:+ start:723 stop:974 length:252 start_codon:yes stop_codon:yes gene_type:complete
MTNSNDTLAFSQFVRNMWLRNCEEREAYNEALLDLKEYSKINREFLLDKYWSQGYGDLYWDYDRQEYVDECYLLGVPETGVYL